MFCCENAEVKVAARIKLYIQCVEAVLKERLGDRIPEEELAYIELLIAHKYMTGLEYDIDAMEVRARETLD